MKKSFFIFLVIFVVVSLACNVNSTGIQPTAPAATDAPAGAGEQAPAAAPTATEAPTPTPEPTPTPIPSDPVSIRRGLASLNSYTFIYQMLSKGPEPQTMSQYHTEMRASQDQDASVSIIQVTESSIDSPEPSTSTQYIYSIGLERCQGSEEDWEFSTVTPDQDELLNVMSDMIDILPLIDDPVYVGSETLNGVLTDHFSFTISGIGVLSGAQATANQGEYWLAQDGRYLVKYSLLLELNTTPEEVSHLEIYMELTNINQPVEISFPAACQP